MDTKTKTTLSDFAIKAAQRLEDKKVSKKATLYIPSLEQNITIRSLSRAEIMECSNVEDTDDDLNKSDRYTIYIATVEPNLREIATELKADNKIIEYDEVVNIFDIHEQKSIAVEIMKLSGIMSDKKVALVNTLKN